MDPQGAWPDEESVLVTGLDTAAAVALARHFGQNALVWMDARGTPELMCVTEPEGG